LTINKNDYKIITLFAKVEEIYMEIRLANLSDCEKIVFLEKQIFEFHSNARPDWIDKNKIGFIAGIEYFVNIIKDEKCRIFVVEENKNIIGFCVTQIRTIKDHPILFDMKNIEIEDFCIDENYRHKGIGKKLFEEVKKYAKEIEARNVELSVWNFNGNAIKFYESNGMKIRINRMELKTE
jgi:ribosomal protein S18 acetylase RimI-like enzyme